MVSETGGWIATGRREVGEEDNDGVAGTAGMNGDSVNGAAVVGDRFDVSTARKAGDLVMLVDGTAADFDNNAAADDDLVKGEAGGGLVNALHDSAKSGPAGKLEMAALAGDWETVVLCGSSWEKETEADVLATGTHASVYGHRALASAAMRVAAGDLATVFAVNSGYASSESGSSPT